MNDSGVTRVARSDLMVLKELGVGGQGRVDLVAAPGFDEPMAYKAYNDESLRQVDAVALEELIRFRRQADQALQDTLAGQTAWPAAVVHDSGRLTGFLMPPAPIEYTSYLRMPDGMKPQLLAMEFLLNPIEYMASVDLPVTERQRMELLAKLAALLTDLHRAGVVIGDLSPKNVLVRRSPPGCYLLDVDSVRIHGRSVLPQVETPDWTVPAGEECGTPASDRYKFALVALRVLQSDQHASQPSALRPRHPELAALAERGLLTATGGRTELHDWSAGLLRALPTASTDVPTVQFIRPQKPSSQPQQSPTYPQQPPIYPPQSPTYPQQPQAYPQQPPAYPQQPSPARPPQVFVPKKSGALKKFKLTVGAVLAVLALCWCLPKLAKDDQSAATGTPPGYTVDETAAQAAGVQAILDPSRIDRQNLVTAVAQIESCQNVAANIAVLQQVGERRRTELRMTAAQSFHALPNGAELATNLTSALEHSLAADQAFVSWGQDVLNANCARSSISGGWRTTALEESKHSTAAKKRFVVLWNPVATRFGHPVIQETDL